MMIPNVRLGLGVAIPSVLAAFMAISCGGSDGSEVDSGKGANGTGANGNGQPNLGGSGPGGPGTGGSTGTTPINEDAACATGKATADAIPAVVQMVVDISGSMNWGANGSQSPPRGQSKWDITSAALKDAVEDLPSTVAVGINFYPNNPARGQCLRNRVDLPLGLLGDLASMQRRSFNEAIDRADPEDGTPTHGAFLFGAQTVAASDLDGRKFVLLITDGVPTYNLDCSGDGQTGVENDPLIAAVEDTFKGEQISTFVIGSPGSEDARDDLSKMASVGGTAKAGCSNDGPDYCHLDMTSAADFGAALAAGLAEIAGRISACEYAVPEPPNGKTLDPTLVNVLYTKADGAQTSIPQDPTGKCQQGWVYDNVQNPTKVTLCGADCDAIKADPKAQIDLLFGCVTDVGEPPK
jgi:von Willebrand factor type A domain